MSMEHAWSALLGGVLIGLAAALHLFAQGRIAGISGLLGESLRAPLADGGVRLSFLGGLVSVGIAAALVLDHATTNAVAPLGVVVVGGLLVGFGTRRGNGCTSGHGVCGIARFSRRSIVATGIFMATAALTVFLTHHVFTSGGFR
ncbi:MAG: YeeE/YedE family protein [Deltaproteobacteria bacterium]|nr:YeeE/YedE family protein [Deltaproteobacteria bacterium]